MTQESRLAIVIDTTRARPSADELRRSMSALDDAGIRVTQTNAQVNKSIDSMSAQSSAAAASIRRGLVAVLGGLSAMAVIDDADSWGQYASRIRMATNSAEEYEHVQKRMADSARSTYRSINETRESFIQMSPVLRDMGLSLDQSIDAVDTFSGLLVVNGANAERGSAAMGALAKSFQRGRVDADAWMTIYSTVDNIVGYIAETTGKTAEEIRKLGIEGKLSAAVLAQSLVDANQEVAKAVEGMPTTVRDALQNLNTSFTEYIGWKNEAQGATAAMASGIRVLGENFETVANIIGVTAAGALVGYTVKTVRATAATVAGLMASLEKARAHAIEADAANKAAQSAKVLAGLDLDRAKTAVTSAEAQVAADRAAQIGNISRLRDTQTLMAAENALEVQRIKAQISDIGRQQAATRMAEIRVSEVAIAKQIEAAEKALAGTTVATSAVVQKSYADRAVAAGAYAATTKAANETAAQAQRAAAATSVLARSGAGLLSILGGPAGLAAAAGIAATSFFLFRDSAKEVDSSLLDLRTPLDQIIEKFRTLNQDQRAATIVKYMDKQVEETEKLSSAVDDLIGKIRASQSETSYFLNMTAFRQLEADIRSAASEGESIAPILEKAAKAFGIPDSEMQSWVKQAGVIADTKGNLNQYNLIVETANRLHGELDASARGAAGGINLLNQEFTNDAGKKYLESLTDQSITAGLTKRREQLDALVKAGKLAYTTEDLAKAQAAADKIDAASGAKKLSDGQKYIEQAIERIGLIGKETEAEKLLGQMSVGSLKFRNQAEYERAIQLAGIIDQKQREVEIEQTLRDLRSQQSITQAQFMRELASFGQGDRVRELNGDLAKVEDRYRGIIDARRNSPLGLSDDELARIRESLEVELGMVRDYHDKKLSIQQNWSLGAQDSLKNYSDQASNVYRSMGDAVGNAFKGMEDSLVSFVKSGKLEFGDLADSIISDMIRIAMQQSITGPLAGAFGGWLSGLGGTGASTIGAGTAAGGAGAIAFPVSLWTGGYTGDGGKYEPAGIVHKGEGVLSQEEIRAIGGERGFNELRKAISGRGHSMGGMAGSPSLPSLPGAPATATAAPVINVTNKGTPQQVESASARWDGEKWVLGIVMNDIRRNGPLGQMMRGAGVV